MKKSTLFQWLTLIYLLIGYYLLVKAQPKPAFVREADLMWCKKVWRIIDVREKLNQAYFFGFPGDSAQRNLFEVIRDGVLSQEIPAYAPDQITWKWCGELNPAQVEKLFIKKDSINYYDVNAKGEEVISRIQVTDTLGGEEILQYKIVEDWFFDKQRSVMEVRIIGICPMRYDAQKDLYIPLFWIPFAESTAWLDKHRCINAANIAENRSYYECFIKRKFGSFVIKESNVYDREIKEYLSGIDAIVESEKINEKILNYESDLWQY